MKQIVTESMIDLYKQLILELMAANNIERIVFEEGDPLYYAAGVEYVEVFENGIIFVSQEWNDNGGIPDGDLYWYWLRDAYSKLLHMICRK